MITSSVKLFYMGLFRLLKNNVVETNSCIESCLKEGVATYLFQKYTGVFNDIGFSSDHLFEVDEYFKTWIGCFDGNEFRKYDCQNDDGLWLLFACLLEQ